MISEEQLYLFTSNSLQEVTQTHFHGDFKKYLIRSSRNPNTPSILNLEYQLMKVMELFDFIEKNPSEYIVISRKNEENNILYEKFAKKLGITFMHVKPSYLSVEGKITQKNLIFFDDRNSSIEEAKKYPYFYKIIFYTGNRQEIKGSFNIPFTRYSREKLAMWMGLVFELRKNEGYEKVPPGFDPGSLAPKAEGITSTSRDSN